MLLRVAACFGIAAALAWGGWRCVPPWLARRDAARRHEAFVRRQAECLEYTFPPGAVAAGKPACWTFFNSWPGNFDDTLFLHRRTSPGGANRLVVVEGKKYFYQIPPEYGDRGPETYHMLALNAYVVEPDNVHPEGMELNPGHGPIFGTLLHIDDRRFEMGDAVRCVVFGGRHDESDASHFTIGYAMDGARGTIDGWLEDGDSVRLRVRDGSAATYHPE